jgi:succinyl-diaminopimelate desuccinylase
VLPELNPVRLLEQLIRCPSVTPEDAGVLGVLEDVLRPLGFTVTRLRFEGDGSYPVDNLFATRAGTRAGPHLLFGGHTDVVAPGDPADWSDSPFGAVERDGVLFGRGAADMKSGVAAFVTAAARAVEAGAADGGRISLAITNDEEADAINGTEKLLAWAAAEGHRFDFAIVGEPSARERVGDSIKIGRRGSLNGRIVVEGVQGHSAYPERARNPLPAMAAIVMALSGRADEGSDYFPATNVEFTSVDVGNQTTNVIPARATARFNVRFNERWTPETLTAHLRERGRDAAAPFEVGYTLEVVGRPSNSFLSPLGPPVEQLCDVIAEATGSGPELATFGGTSDARFIAAYCPVVEFGLPGPSMHKVDEHVKTADVIALTDLYARFIAAYVGPGPENGGEISG